MNYKEKKSFEVLRRFQKYIPGIIETEAEEGLITHTFEYELRVDTLL